ncbi:MAG: OmpH family outer membrane protein [Magnetococcales bacterium]|nr:OmpH family outer membrane protein [Magnetococcales bacterium]MBF0155965.1 OmpH family outer membrane protein [Magnetococcales bacterium]
MTAALVVLSLVFSLSRPVLAESARKDPPQQPFAFVDVAQVYANSEAGRSIIKMLQEKQKANREKEKAMEADLKNMKADLAKRQSVLKPDALSELTTQITSKFTEYKRIAEDNQAALDRENSHWNGKINGMLVRVVKELGAERGFIGIFGPGQLLYHDAKIDITAEVLERFNARTKDWGSER